MVSFSLGAASPTRPFQLLKSYISQESSVLIALNYSFQTTWSQTVFRLICLALEPEVYC